MQNFCISHEEAPKIVKTLRKQCAVVILTLALAVSAFGGQIQGPGAIGTGTGTTLLADVIVTVITVIP